MVARSGEATELEMISTHMDLMVSSYCQKVDVNVKVYVNVKKFNLNGVGDDLYSYGFDDECTLPYFCQIALLAK